MVPFGLGRDVHPFSSSHRWILHAKNVQYLPSTTGVDIDLKWRHSPLACFLQYETAYFPVLFRKSRPSCHFRTLTAYNKQTKMNFQKLISKPFSTCLNLSNKLNLWKRCIWPLRSPQPLFTKFAKFHISARFFVRVFVLGWYTYFETAQAFSSLCFREKEVKTLKIYEWHSQGTFFKFSVFSLHI